MILINTYFIGLICIVVKFGKLWKVRNWKISINGSKCTWIYRLSKRFLKSKLKINLKVDFVQCCEELIQVPNGCKNSIALTSIFSQQFFIRLWTTSDSENDGANFANSGTRFLNLNFKICFIWLMENNLHFLFDN